MANPKIGYVDLPAGETTYTLRLSVNALVEAETLLDKSINDIIATLDRVGTLRAIMWAALLEKHPNTTLLDAGEIIGAVGADAAGVAIGEALKAAFPDDLKGDARPPKAARAGTGKAS